MAISKKDLMDVIGAMSVSDLKALGKGVRNIAKAKTVSQTLKKLPDALSRRSADMAVASISKDLGNKILAECKNLTNQTRKAMRR